MRKMLTVGTLAKEYLRVEGPKVGHQLGILSPVTFQPSMLVAQDPTYLKAMSGVSIVPGCLESEGRSWLSCKDMETSRSCYEGVAG
jgi:hypothetical protein